jgi:acetyl-CoA carboxylase biotin carboxyl carrier protein
MSETTPDQSAAQADDFGLSAVRELLRLINQTDITEILIERGDVKLHLKRGPLMQPVTAAPAAPQIAAVNPPHAPVAPSPSVQPFITPPPMPQGPPASMPAGHTILAPMVGTFYASPSPKDGPFVQEGDVIHVGERVGIIEAMKMMNEIESEFSGRVARILVKNAQGVEYGQPLMVIEPL